MRIKILLLVLIIQFGIGCKDEIKKIDPIYNDCKNTNAIRISSDIITESIDSTLVIPIKYHFIFSDSSYITTELKSIDTSLYKINAELNKAYNQYIHFEADSFYLYTIHDYSIEKLYNNYQYENKKIWDSIIEKNAVLGSLNIFILKSTASKLDNTSNLIGFTPVLIYNFYDYEKESPKYDNVIISYNDQFGSEVSTTIIHEIGHWLGLSHPFDMTVSDKIKLGLTSNYKICINYMNYNCFISEFTPEQLKVQYNFAKKYRYYLLKK